MAKILFGDGITDARGKVGGSVYTKNRYGAVRRRKVTPTNPKTSFQNAVRSQFTTLTQGFRALTAAQIVAWNAAVQNFKSTNIFKQSKVLTGHALYIKINRNLQSSGNALISDPPVPNGINDVLSGTLLANTTGSVLTVAVSQTVPAGETVIVEATAPMSAGKQPSANQYRHITVKGAATASPFDIKAAYIAKFGALPAIGQRISVRLRTVSNSTGEAGNPSTSNAIAV